MYEICFGGSEIIFQGYEDDCWKFLIGFCGYKMRNETKYGIMDFNGCWCDYGTIQITELND